jgi:hypothetical protein
MANLRVSYAFASLPQGEIDNFTKGVSDKLYTDPAYQASAGPPAVPGPPVTKTALDNSNGALTSAIWQAKTGGHTDTVVKDTILQNHLGLLRQLAAFVQTRHGNDLAVLLGSGFEAASTERTAVVLTKPEELSVSNGNGGQLIARVKKVKGCHMYEGRATPEGGAPLPSVFTGDSQHIYFDNLTPGVVYKIEVRCLGGADPGYTDWSDPTTHRAM